MKHEIGYRYGTVASIEAAIRKIVIGTLWESDKPDFTERWGEFVKGFGELG